MRLILASRSPQRRAILEQAGLGFEVRPADVEELEQGDPEEVAAENARRKALAVAALPAASGALVLGVDTVVALDGRLYGQPAGREEALATLGALSGRTHEVLSGVALATGGEDAAPREAVAVTGVTFRALSAAEIARYADTGEWRGRAGAYAIQQRGATLVDRIEGDYLNVVGLPLATLLELEPGLRSMPQPPCRRRA